MVKVWLPPTGGIAANVSGGLAIELKCVSSPSTLAQRSIDTRAVLKGAETVALLLALPTPQPAPVDPLRVPGVAAAP
jgi:hypothetical protein